MMNLINHRLRAGRRIIWHGMETQKDTRKPEEKAVNLKAREAIPVTLQMT